MQNLGFGIFGRPVGHEYISNGLFKELHLEGQTYLDPHVVTLNKGERMVQVSRLNMNEFQIIKIYVYDYARSFNNRPGGFVGSACVFTGRPTKNLFDHINSLHKQTKSLLNSELQFLSGELNIPEDKLESPQSRSFIEGPPIPITASNLSNDKYAVYTEGPVLNHLISVVQGFMYNPNFSKLETIYVSDNEALLKRIENIEPKNILGIGHILNFQNRFDSLNKKLNEKKTELEEFNSKFALHKNKKEQELRNSLVQLDTEIRDKSNTCSNLDSDIIRKQNKIDDLNPRIERLEKTKRNLDTEVQNLERKKRELNENNFQSFNQIVNSKKFRNERSQFINQSHEVGELNREIKKLKEENKSLQPKWPIQQKLLVFGGIILFFSIISFLIGHYHVLGRLKYELTSDNKTQQIANQPKPAVTDSISQQNDDPPEKGEDGDVKEPSNDFLAMIATKDYDENNPFSGMQAFAQHYNTFKSETNDKEYGIKWVDSKFIKANLKFKEETDPGHDVLDRYVAYHKNDNIFTRLDIDSSSSAAYMYFRWMVWKLNDSLDINNHQFNNGEEINVYIIQ